ncbi:ParB/RepB/Spo0J family partition protein [Sphingomonas bacterium]|uniref:ParB/RepB/Spo0J family partition protein n=1 Tax=Sphingomonas bacterium TaxID=1895847 RepID=UPI0015773743|nr:ParB N-terminal domain-containing protein [Sphingomonas bacterium]
MTPVARLLPIAAIGELPDDQYVGLIDEAAIACLRVRLAAEGLLSPIWVRQNGNASKAKWSVIAGRHRLRAAAALGWTEIETIEKAGPASGADELRRLQIAENLDRRVLRPIERACHIMERWREAAATVVPSGPASQQSAAVRSRWIVWAADAHTPVGEVRAVDDAAGAACGLKGRAVRDYRKIHAAIVVALPRLFAQLNAHPLGESVKAMAKLASLATDTRARVAELILSRPDWPNMQAVMVAAGLEGSTGNRVDPTRPDATVIGAIAMMSAPRRQATYCELARVMIPTDALALIKIFKERSIIGDGITIA